MILRVRRTVGAVLLLAALAGCGDDDDPVAEQEPTAPQKLQISETYVQAGDPEWLVGAFDVVWVHKDDGDIVAFDPESGEVTQTLDSGYHDLPACQGLGHDAAGLWSCAGDAGLVRLDPVTGAATPVPAKKRSDEGRLAYSGGLLWYLETGSNDLVGLDQDAAQVARVPLGEVCTDLAYDDQLVFALCPTGQHVLRVDPAAQAVTGTLDVQDPRNGTVGTDLFVGNGSGLLQVDTDSLEVVHTYDDVGPGLLGNVAATGDEVWVREQDGTFLTEIDPATHQVLATVDAPDITGGGDVLITESWIWATASDDGVVVRVARPGR
jgi:streptogramin lyase